LDQLVKQIDTEDEIELQEQPTHDRPFNSFRLPLSTKVRAVVDDVLAQLQAFERAKNLRQRKRRLADQATFEQTVAAVVCDLAHRAITRPDGWVSVPLSNQFLGRANRYRAPAMNKALPDILDRLSAPEMAFIEMEVGYQGVFGPSRRTVLHAGPRLLSRIAEHGIGLEDLGVSPDQEVIRLKREKADFWDEGGLVEYEDTDKTHQYRAEMKEINDWLAAADIQFDPDATPSAKEVVDDTERRLCRYFTRGSFESGGRLFGGFWQSMPKWQRRKGLLIDGEEVATLDFGQMAPRILYGMEGIQITTSDAYLLPGLERCRAGVKKLMNAMLFAEKPLSRFPKETRKLFPTRVSLAQVVERLEEVHAPIRHRFFTGIGHQTQFVESEILVDVLLELKRQGIVGLPVHDAVIVPRSNIHPVTTIMLEVFKQHTGMDGLISEDD